MSRSASRKIFDEYAGDEYFDACFIAMVPLRTDARTLNMARTLVSAGKKVAVIALGEEWEVQDFLGEKIWFFPVESRRSRRMLLLWRHFTVEARRLARSVKSRSYWAEDLYSLPVAVKFARRYSAKVFYDSREIYSALGSLSRRPVAQKVIALVEKFYIRKLDEIIVTGALDAEYLGKYFGWRKKFHLIMNLPPYWEALSADLLRQQFSLPAETRILIYQGMLLQGRGIIPVLRALRHLEENIVLCLLGDGDFRAEIEREAQKLDLSARVFFTGLIPYDELPRWTASADLGLSLIEPVTLSYRLALPNKLFEYIMARIPSLASDLPALRRLLEEYPVGELVDPNASPDEIARKISAILLNPSYKSACDTAAQVFCREAQEKNILSLAATI